MILKNADIFDFDFNLRRADLRVEDGLIAEIGAALGKRTDGQIFRSLRHGKAPGGFRCKVPAVQGKEARALCPDLPRRP